MRWKRWTRQFQYECKVMVDRPLWLLIPVFFGVWMYQTLSVAAPPVSEDLYYYLDDYNKLQHVLTLSISMILGILFIRRDMIQPSYEWMSALPISRIGIWSAKWLVGMIYMSLFILFPLGVYVFLSLAKEVPSDALWRTLTLFIPLYVLSYALTLTIGMTLAAWIRNRIVYFIGLCGWMFGTYFNDIVLVEILQLNPLKLFHLTQFLSGGFHYHELWATPWLMDETLRYGLFATAFIVTLSVCGIMLLQSQQPGRTVKNWKMAFVGSVVLLLLSAVPYGMMWGERLAWSKKFAESARIFEQVNELYPEQMMKLEETNVQVTRQNDRVLKFDASLTGTFVEEGHSVIPFTLDVPFYVENVKLNGKSVNFEREGQFILVSNREGVWKKGERATISFDYMIEGIVRSYSEGNEVVSHSAVKDGMHFKHKVAWYPLMNQSSLYGSDGSLQRSSSDRSPERHHMRLTLVGFDESVYTNISELPSLQQNNSNDIPVRQYESLNASGMDLWSGPFLEVNIPHSEVTLLTTPSNKQEAERFAGRVGKALAYYHQWLPVHEHIKQIVYMPQEEIASASYTGEVVGNSYYIRQSKHGNLDDYQLTLVLEGILFGEPSKLMSYYKVDLSESLVMELRLMLLEMYRMEVDSQMKFPMRERHHTVKKFTTAYMEGKSEELKNLLRYYYETYNRFYIDVHAINYFYNKGLLMPEGLYPVITEQSFHEKWSKVMGHE
ncbi:ABC transporter permease [Paenibacillus assamensis]|uniref:ABC transporter permease n=1 Tax=Paenibacillus assamensis TaxID=311244 RepID=UPI00048BE982|nr:ABC transporter permease [Paenibacillus assamensis]